VKGKNIDAKYELEAGCILAYQILSPGEVPLDFISS
jgi:hypothetical protein